MSTQLDRQQIDQHISQIFQLKFIPENQVKDLCENKHCSSCVLVG